MFNEKNILFIIFIFNFGLLSAQSNQNKKDIIVHSPSKAAFYSAVLPGLGQFYNKQYWKIPIVYGAIGTSLYLMVHNNERYQSFRQAYFDRKAGIKDEYHNVYLNESTLVEAQDYYSQQFVYSILFAVGFYFLNVIEANVAAHLLDYNLDEKISNVNIIPYFNIEDEAFMLCLSLNI